jgi:SRSO17 transposase
MEAMLARVTDPGSYQAFQHFVTHAPWRADPAWRRLRETLPERRRALIIDATTFLKQGHHSVGVGRQYCGLQRQIVNGQTAVTAALWTGARAYLVGVALYLPDAWMTAAARDHARIPADVRFQEKWRQALTLIRQVRASGIEVTAVLADAAFGDMRPFRAMLHRLRLPYAVGVSTHLTAFRGRPRVQPVGAPRGRYGLAPGVVALPIAELVAATTQRWRRIQWRNHPAARPCRAECVALRVTPAIDHRHRRLPPEVWLLAEREPGARPKTKYFYVNLPPTASLAQIVRLAHQRWAIEQQYRELKTELGFDHFEGRSYPGWHHHAVLTAITYNFLQGERRRSASRVTFSFVRAVVQEIFTAYLFAQRPRYLQRIEALKSVQLRI